VQDSEHEAESGHGLLFRIGARFVVIVFAVVLGLSLSSGMDPTLALVRSLVVLLVLTGCGWLAEQAVRSAHTPQPIETVDAAQPRSQALPEPHAKEEDEDGTRAA
jgi:hypothetical protein